MPEGKASGIGVLVKYVEGDEPKIPRDVAQRERERGVIRVRIAGFIFRGELPPRMRKPVGGFRVYDAAGNMIAFGILEWRTLYMVKGLPSDIQQRIIREFELVTHRSIYNVPLDILELAMAIAAALGVEGVEAGESGVLVDGKPLEDLVSTPSGLMKLRTKMCMAIRRLAEARGITPNIRVKLKTIDIVC